MASSVPDASAKIDNYIGALPPWSQAIGEALPPSAKRDHCEWVGGAKWEETRSRRLKSALEGLARQERLYEKYR